MNIVDLRMKQNAENSFTRRQGRPAGTTDSVTPFRKNGVQ